MGVNVTTEERISGFQIVVLILSLFVLVSMVTDAAMELPTEVSRMLQSFDNVVCGVFLLDFVIRLRQSTDKVRFMKWGWIDLIASIPNVDVLRWGRAVRILRIIRILRGVRSFHKVLAITFRHKVKSGLGALLTTSLLLITFASLAILMCETGEGANIKTAEDALWWSVTTITTVGYGDRYPVSTEGRVLAMVLMAAGVGLFGTLSGIIALFFLGSEDQSSNKEIEALTAEIKILQKEVVQLREATRSNGVVIEERSYETTPR
jgi:voltage-gated potassium channel